MAAGIPQSTLEIIRKECVSMSPALSWGSVKISSLRESANGNVKLERFWHHQSKLAYMYKKVRDQKFEPKFTLRWNEMNPAYRNHKDQPFSDQEIFSHPWILRKALGADILPAPKAQVVTFYLFDEISKLKLLSDPVSPVIILFIQKFSESNWLF